MKKSKSVWQNIHQDLIDNCRKGDSKAQFELYRLYYRNMYNVSLRIVNDTQEAEDIMQEAFFSAFENIGSYSGQVSFGAWLRRIVINRSLDALKKRRLDLQSIDEGPDPEIPEDAEADKERAETVSAETERIHRCINLLPDGYRVILSLYLLEGYDHEEIAGIMGITASTSRSQYTRAKNRLAEMLKKSRSDGQS
ncbi:MAG: RNA polymerase sigma factor [Marinilabiliales bacterium]|nr:MAG: RNA polymerase sigma factor [Marinilabiliales bacterium]